MEMVLKEEFLHLFDRFAFLISQPDVKQRILDVVNHKQMDMQEAVSITIAIEEEIFQRWELVSFKSLNKLTQTIFEYANASFAKRISILILTILLGPCVSKKRCQAADLLQPDFVNVVHVYFLLLIVLFHEIVYFSLE